ncbi:hypothetical protein G7054_g2584 [Neopestalotiopsis clavispora]|nr:hypothetical protein G7054_g2584 [Neopestalotiopsis clavispora]
MTYLEKYRSGRINRWGQRLLRLLQFLTAIISLGFFSRRLNRLLHLTRGAYNRGEGAVEGILAAAVLYSILAMVMACLLRHGGPKILRWLFVLMDILFIGAFIAVAVLTRRHGPAGAYGGECNTDGFLANAVRREFRRRHGCNLPWGTFVLAIISTILYALSALFHEVKDRRNRDPGYDTAAAGKGRHSHHSTSTYNTYPEQQQVNPDGSYPVQAPVGNGTHTGGHHVGGHHV